MGTQENVQRKAQTLCPVADTPPQFVVPSATALTGQGFSPSVFCFRIKQKQNPDLPPRRPPLVLRLRCLAFADGSGLPIC